MESSEPFSVLLFTKLNPKALSVVSSRKRQKNLKYIQFYDDLLERTKRFRYVYIDLTPANIVFEGDGVKIIDLEPVLPIDEVNNTFFWMSILS